MKPLRIMISILSLPLLFVFVIPFWCYLVLAVESKEAQLRANEFGGQLAEQYKKFVNWSWQ